MAPVAWALLRTKWTQLEQPLPRSIYPARWYRLSEQVGHKWREFAREDGVRRRKEEEYPSVFGVEERKRVWRGGGELCGLTRECTKRGDVLEISMDVMERSVDGERDEEYGRERLQPPAYSCSLNSYHSIRNRHYTSFINRFCV